ncbi:hypothetical protein MHW47_08945 [Streptomyces sp. OfavH-34-F]|uniref:hypothetical protein n=1 Tax=Streptomyces sp. OfavH-34-F TaxID=2917760 RepID=UPI001EF2DC70|nr:hypothetical protein [Streptomyces sp. OfavH-34-F]MCG7524561.1 hypothetical protein [Streptomyces sp. OfavH-34-F]
MHQQRTARAVLDGRARSGRVVAAVAAGLLCGLTACSSGGSDEAVPTPGSSSPSSASPTASAQDGVKKEIAEVVRRMREEETKAHVDPGKVSDTKLTDYVTDKALAEINNQLFHYEQLGLVFEGSPKSSVTVTAVNLKSSPHRATVEECVDTTGWKPVEKSTGKDVATDGQPRRYIITYRLEIFGEKAQWMVMDLTRDKERSC